MAQGSSKISGFPPDIGVVYVNELWHKRDVFTVITQNGDQGSNSEVSKKALWRN